jgi:RNA polymerase sigma-70 factor (ECF subfamily)
MPDEFSADETGQGAPADADSRSGGAGDVCPDRFLRLYSHSQRRVHNYIATFVYDPTAVDEVLQETSIVLWRKFSEFRDEGDFYHWACGVARLEILKYLRIHQRTALPLDEHVVELISAERQAMDQGLDDRREALEHCLGTLREVDRALVQRCYAGIGSFKAVAVELGRPVNAVYKSLGRIRAVLFECIERRLITEEGR